MQHDATLHDRNTMDAVVRRAIDGDEAAFQDLYACHAGTVWRFSYALTGTRQDAVTVTSETFARTFTALRAASEPRPEFATLLLQTTRNTAIDVRKAHGGTLPPFEATDATLDLALAFAALPERWRSALWLGVVERESQARVAATIGLDHDATAQIVARARKGLREQYRRVDADRGESRNCDRALARLSPYVAGILPSADIDKLERHLRLCPACSGRYDRLVTLTDRLPHLVPVLPAMLEDDVRIAWTGAVATASSGLGISQLGEKLLAGVAAVAVGVGVLGAAMVGISGSDSGDLAVSPIAPLVAELAAPRPDGLDLSIDLDPAATSNPTGERRASSTDGRDDVDRIRPANARPDDAPIVTDLSGGSSDTGTGTGGGTTPGGDSTDGTTPGGGGDESPPPHGPGSGTPLVSVGTDLGDVPVAVDVGQNPGLTVGPVSVGSRPTPGGDTITVGGGLQPLAPIVAPVNDVVGGLLGR